MHQKLAALIAGLAGFAIMSLELTAVRLMAPHFGDSAYVWTNVIGVILVALAVGAFLGGRMADRDRGAPRLALLFLIAAVLVAVAPVVARPLGALLLPQELPLDAAMPALVRGSLSATLLLFAPPVLLLGTASPILVTLVAAGSGRVGAAVGAIASSSTLGSLAGTFATTHLLVPELGSRATLWLCAALMVVCALLCRPSKAAAAALLLPLLLALLPWGDLRAPAPGWELLAESESPYQFLQVVRDPSAEGGAVTALKINEGLDSFHSVKVAGSDYSGRRYYDYHALVPFLIGDGARPDRLRVLSLGDAAGTFNRLFAAAHPGCRMDAVELDAEVIALGERWFGGRAAEGSVFAGMDARVFVERSRSEYELVLVDAYEHQVYVPAHVASREFFTAVRERLVPGGGVAINTGGIDFDDPVMCRLAATMADVFGESWSFRVPRSRNFMVVARRDAVIDPGVLERVRVDDPELTDIVVAGRRGNWRRFGKGDGSNVLVDDRPVLDELLSRSYLDAVTEPTLTACLGSESVAAAGEDARQALSNGDPRRALAAVARASAPSAYLRLQAGDARWLLRELGSAMLEYEEAQRLDEVGDFAAILAGRIEGLREDLELQERAVSVATQNGWIACGLGLLLGVLFAVAWRLR